MGFPFLRLNPERATRQRSVNFEIDACFPLKKNGGNLRQARLGQRNIRFDTEDSQPSMAHVAVGHETTNLRVLDAVLRCKPSREDRFAGVRCALKEHLVDDGVGAFIRCGTPPSAISKRRQLPERINALPFEMNFEGS